MGPEADEVKDPDRIVDTGADLSNPEAVVG